MKGNRKRGQGLSWTVAPVEEEDEEKKANEIILLSVCVRPSFYVSPYNS
jgi:hypothetical protein